MNLTLRDVDVLLTRIAVREHNEFATEAALHGIKEKIPRIELKHKNKDGSEELSQEQMDQIYAHLEKAQKRTLKERGRGRGKTGRPNRR